MNLDLAQRLTNNVIDALLSTGEALTRTNPPLTQREAGVSPLKLPWGEALAVNDLVYVKTADSKVYKASNAARTTMSTAMVQRIDGADVVLRTAPAIVENLTGVTAGSVYVLGTAGGFVAEASGPNPVSDRGTGKVRQEVIYGVGTGKGVYLGYKLPTKV